MKIYIGIISGVYTIYRIIKTLVKMFTKKKVKLTQCQKNALKMLKGKDNIFLTGAAGSGKSFVVEKFIENKLPHKYPIVASTGAAAIIVGGRTFHSFFGLGIMEGGYSETIKRALKNRRIKTRLKRAECIIIDEISMIPGEVLRAAEEITRKILKADEPWAGIRIITVGDFAQLPPVSRFSKTPDWCFLDPVWQVTGFKKVELKEIVRSREEEFLKILNKVRNGKVDENVKNFIESRLVDETFDSDMTKLFPRKKLVESINIKKLSELPGELVTIETQYEAENEKFIEKIKKDAPVPEELRIKVGALAMIRRNDVNGEYVNGSLGYIRRIGKEEIEIDLLDGYNVEIEKTLFSLLDADGKIVATANNFPINLAYATTIHKAQGMTLDRAMVDLRGLWEAGHAYVAMSRVKSAEGLHICGWSPGSIKTDKRITEFYNKKETVI